MTTSPFPNDRIFFRLTALCPILARCCFFEFGLLLLGTPAPSKEYTSASLFSDAGPASPGIPNGAGGFGQRVQIGTGDRKERESGLRQRLSAHCQG